MKKQRKSKKKKVKKRKPSDKKPRINFRCETDLRTRMQQRAKEEGFENLSDLMRHALAEYLSGPKGYSKETTQMFELSADALGISSAEVRRRGAKLVLESIRKSDETQRRRRRTD